MFDKKDKNEKGLGQTNRIVEGTVITGNVESKTDFRLDGVLIGNYTSTSKLVIGPSGEVQGDIKCVNVDIEGKFTGKLDVSELLGVKATARIKGEVIAGKLSVEPGAVFDASCEMKSSIKKTVDEKSEKTA